MIKMPLLMPYQEVPFNGDKFIEKSFIELRDKHGIKTAVETGTCFGSTTMFLSDNFERVYSIEINLDYLTIANERIKQKGCENVKTYFDDSSVLLGELIKDEKIGNDTIFFLDGHWQERCPLLDELLAISSREIKPVIAIHDFKVPNSKLGFDSYEGKDFEIKLVSDYLDMIYGIDKWDHHYNTDTESEGAKRGIIYIYPKS